MLFVDEFSQTSSEMLGVLDIIFRQVKESNTYIGGVLIIFTMDHLQTQPIKEHSLLISSQIIPCFQMVSLKFSVRAMRDVNFRRVQEIVRMSYSNLVDRSNDFVKEFTTLVGENCTFVDSWNHPSINEKTYRLYSKKVPAKIASRQYAERMRRCVVRNNYITRLGLDVEKSRFLHSEWYTASRTSIDQIEVQCKEPTELLFFQGGHYESTYNKEDCFS